MQTRGLLPRWLPGFDGEWYYLTVPPPDAQNHLPRLRALLDEGRAGVFCDLDGTLAPIVDHPDEAMLAPGAREALTAARGRGWMVCIVSGRPVAQLVAFVAIEGLEYVGNHGSERWVRGQVVMEDVASQAAWALSPIVPRLRRLTEPEGVMVEDKGSTIALHYRNAPDPVRARSWIVTALRQAQLPPRAVTREGKMVIEVLLASCATKADAVRLLTAEHRLERGLYLGDDTTDLDGFDAIHGLGPGHGAAIAVLGGETPSVVRDAADYTLAGVSATVMFLHALAA